MTNGLLAAILLVQVLQLLITLSHLGATQRLLGLFVGVAGRRS